MAVTRAEHLTWCKERAKEYAEQGNLQDAFASLVSDLSKHDETVNSVAAVSQLGMMELLAGTISTSDQMVRFIDGVN